MASSDDLVYFLKQPGSYPNGPESVDHIQTHISHLFMAGEYVYKVKKPLDLGFLDFSTLDRREHYCNMEVKLNRRLCAEIYLGVVPIYKHKGNFSFEAAGGTSPVEFAVKMKRLDEQYFLIRHAREGTLTHEMLDQVVLRLTSFYESCDPDTKTFQWGMMEKVKMNTDENFRQTTSFIGQTIDPTAYDAIRNFTNGYYDQHPDLFRQRVEEGKIVDGHGDLHLEHIHVTTDRVCIYDCVEFSERFRCLDWAADLAFLAMDLDFNGLYNESRYFITRMAERLDDPGLPRATEFYKCYRAYVRGKVRSIESNEEEVPKEARDRAAKVASDYFNLALRYALMGSAQTVLVFMGEIASGKSSLARFLSEKMRMDHYASDPIRKELAGLPLYERPGPAVREELYSEEMSAKTYDRMMDKMEESLAAGHSVILDATFGSPEMRRQLTKRLEDKNEVRLFFIEASAPVDLLRKRLNEREKEKEIVSDARLEDFDLIHAGYTPPDEIDLNLLIRVDTSSPMEQTIEELYQRMTDDG